jgi:prevent-host-death family protein
VKFTIEFRVKFWYNVDWGIKTFPGSSAPVAEGLAMRSGKTTTIEWRELGFMPSIIPVSDLKNYGEVLGHCDDGSPVYLTKNGRGKYVVQSMADYEKQLATIRLLTELSRGVESLRREGGLTIDEAFEGLGV